ncbi:hypothetical protein [Pseudomonas coronafaciens]|uniref:hypothetical protein n=1 Tax=Pseudomonas coronafaciens TaxID=53409 RepID=UPI0011C47C36|nr:hypothetical protein [Pseudomonas coronafaciens]
MRQRLKRISPRHNLCTTNDAEAIQGLPGAVVVWRYERIRKNFDAESVPFVDVHFKSLNHRDEPTDTHVIPIGIGRLASFRPGTIWQNGKCIAETDFGEDKEFTVNFTEDTFSYVSVAAEPGHPSYIADSVRGSAQTAPTVTDFLSFPLPDEKYLLVPCIEFLVRCYGSTPDIARILATHEWSSVQTELYASVEPNPETWLVWPAKHVHNDDALLLASMLYDPYAQIAAKEIYSKLDNAWGLKMKEMSLRVRPWFQGPATIQVRGRWVKGHKMFVCCEITGLSEPQNHPYDIRRIKYSRKDPRAEVVTEINRISVEIPKPQDPFEMTDMSEPDRNAAEWGKPDPGFRTIGPKCRFTLTPEERSYSERKVITHPLSPPAVVSTGDKVGNDTDVDKVRSTARRFAGDGGILNAIWTELRWLKGAVPGFSKLEWYSNHAFHEGPTFKLQSLPKFSDEDKPTEEARRWLAYADNANGSRCMLVICAVINSRSFYLFETQRKKIRKDKIYEEEASFGLLTEINEPALALEEISIICDKIRFCSGKFLALDGLNSTPLVFRHITGNSKFKANATLCSAFAKMNIELKRRGPDPEQAAGSTG